MKETLAEFLRPEFIARVDEVVAFNDLDRAAFVKIAALMLDELKEPLKQKDILFGYDDAALEALSAEAFGGKHAARDLRPGHPQRGGRSDSRPPRRSGGVLAVDGKSYRARWQDRICHRIR